MFERSVLAALLAERMELVTRLASLPPDGRHRVCHDDVESVIEQASSAIDKGEVADLKLALATVELLSFELCDD